MSASLRSPQLTVLLCVTADVVVRGCNPVVAGSFWGAMSFLAGKDTCRSPDTHPLCSWLTPCPAAGLRLWRASPAGQRTAQTACRTSPTSSQTLTAQQANQQQVGRLTSWNTSWLKSKLLHRTFCRQHAVRLVRLRGRRKVISLTSSLSLLRCVSVCACVCFSFGPLFPPERIPQPADEGGQLQLQLLDPDKSDPQPLGLESSFQEYLR